MAEVTKSKAGTADYRLIGATGAETEKRENQKIRKSMGNQLMFSKMKKTLKFSILVAMMAFAFVACKEDPDKYKEDCEKNNTGTLELHSELRGRTIYINDVNYGEMAGGEIKTVELPVGKHTIRFEYPGCKGEFEVEVEQCLNQIIFLMPC